MEKYSSTTSSGSPKSKGLVFGILLIIAGLVFLSLNFGWLSPTFKFIIFSWPMIFIVLSIISFFKRDTAVGFILLILGLFFLIPRIAYIYPDMLINIDTDFARNYWPVLLIILGVLIVLRIGSHRNPINIKNRNTESGSSGALDGRVDRNVVFGGSESIFLDSVFNGGSINAVFGGVVLDLRKTSLPEGETYLDISAIFGGIELYIPDNWHIETKIQTLFGSVEDNRRVLDVDNSRKLIIQGFLTFGGCEIE